MRDRAAGWIDAVEAHLTARFARRAGQVSAGLCLAVVIGWCFTYRDGLDWQAAPVGTDFAAFWWAARVTLAEGALPAYDLWHAWQGQHEYWPGLQGAFAWVYPPSFLLLVLGLGLLPHLVAFGVWTVATVAPYLAVLRRQVPAGGGWLALGFPGLWMGIGQGQNQFLTASLMAGAVLLVRRHPVLAGLCAGLLAIKPHLAVVLPLAYAAARAWRAFASAAATAVLVTVGSAAMLGWGTIPAWFDAMAFVGDAIDEGRLPVWKFVSPYTSLIWLGVPVPAAAAGHAVVAAGAAVAVWRVWRRTDRATLRGIAAMSATFLVTPYSADYDLAWLAFPLAWLAAEAVGHGGYGGHGEHGGPGDLQGWGWRRGERLLLAGGYVAVLTTLPAVVTHVQVAPFILAGLAYAADRRSAPSGPAASPPATSAGA